MRVAILSPTIDVTNGYGNFTFEYCRHLAQQGGIEFTLYLPVGTQLPTVDWDVPTEFQLLPWILLSRNPFRLAHYVLHRIELNNVDLIHSLFAFPYALSAMGNALRSRVPYLVGAQGTYGILPLLHHPSKWFLKQAYDRASRIIVPSRFTAENIRRFANTSTPIEIIHNAIHYERFQVIPDVGELEARFKPGPIILSVGALKRRKGQDTVLKAFKLVKERFPQAKYLLIGTGKWQKRLEALACSLGIRDSVFFLGNVSYDDLVKFYHLCDVYVHLPRNVNWHYEGFGMVFLEAGACGKPVVGTLSGGVPDAVVNDKTGLLVPEDDPRAAAQALMEILSNPALAQRLGENGRKYAQQHSWTQCTKAFVQVYQQSLHQ